MMKLQILLTDENLERPGDQYSRKITKTIIDVENLETSGPVVASLLRGVAAQVEGSGAMKSPNLGTWVA